eukprot:gene10196-11934_t
MRRTTCTYNRIPVDMEFSDVVRYNLQHDDGSREVAVSSVDLLLEDCDAFILGSLPSGFCYGTNCRNGNLNKHGHKVFLPPVADDDYELGMYHEMPTECDQAASSKLNKSALKKIKRNPAQFLFWEGKYYDANKVYIFKPECSNYLQPIGDTLAPRSDVLTSQSPAQRYISEAAEISQSKSKHQPTVEFVKNVAYHNALHQRVNQSCQILHEGQSQNNNQSNYYGGSRMGCWEQLNTSDYLEINLGYPRCVTHIGTTGEFPQTCVFPSRATVGRTRIRKFRAEEETQQQTHLLSHNGNGVKVRKFAPHVRILKEDEYSLSWVTSYEVHYRHTVTNKWTLIGTVPANSDAFTEHILDLSPYFNAKDGLFTQYLRIRPVEYHNKPHMRVSVYGVDKIVATQAAGEGLGEKRVATEAPTSSFDADDVPTITYAITDSTAHHASRYVRDGLRAYYYVDEWHYNLMYKARAMKRQDFQKMMVQKDKTGDT